jgi:cytochrome c5
MIKALYFSAITLTTLLFMACGASKPVASVAMTDADVSRAANKFPGATLASLNEGKMHFEENCGKCHGLKKPGNYTEAEWRNEVPPMAGKANIDKKKEDLILQYVVTMAKP